MLYFSDFSTTFYKFVKFELIYGKHKRLTKFKRANSVGPHSARSHSTRGLAAHDGSLAKSAAWFGLAFPAHSQQWPG
jgi:hypothetical protein